MEGSCRERKYCPKTVGHFGVVVVWLRFLNGAYRVALGGGQTKA